MLVASRNPTRDQTAQAAIMVASQIATRNQTRMTETIYCDSYPAVTTRNPVATRDLTRDHLVSKDMHLSRSPLLRLEISSLESRPCTCT
ncbi:hypothetical protein HanXRQr2_Chr12g0541171 [Helianthus annuus]|uniref:Uncharacterized protein n=1 Tax=Helianthus annuus TaxID=4232 RepID=A0A9K3HGM4_HELAN|nr:hypothetical protein HanXRQr2_Chr12g0541171 [Helianthus annuus]KAJ0862668.1 hypothetical protein HanPSC8_Chr12g0520931 [Helianthus annuus]